MATEKPMLRYVHELVHFGTFSEELQRFKSVLLRGFGMELCIEENSHTPPFLSVSEFDPLIWSYDELMLRACDESGLGMHVMLGQPVMLLGVDSMVTRAINEALDAGFHVHLIGEPALAGHVSGLCTLVTAITDNS